MLKKLAFMLAFGESKYANLKLSINFLSKIFYIPIVKLKL